MASLVTKRNSECQTQNFVVLTDSSSANCTTEMLGLSKLQRFLRAPIGSETMLKRRNLGRLPFLSLLWFEKRKEELKTLIDVKELADNMKTQIQA